MGLSGLVMRSRQGSGSAWHDAAGSTPISCSIGRNGCDSSNFISNLSIIIIIRPIVAAINNMQSEDAEESDKTLLLL